MAAPAIRVGIGVGTQPPLWRVRAMTYLARMAGAEALWTVDHFVGFFPQAIWDEEFSWLASDGSSPDQYFDYQVLLGHLARRVGRRRLAVGVTEPIRRHPVLIAQMAMTLSHVTRRPPILGIGAGERENIEPYGLDFSKPVSVLEEALEVIRMCFDSKGPFDFEGEHFRLDRAMMDLQPAAGRTPEIWVAAHGPRMLRLAGRYGDGWYPTFPMSPDEYAGKLTVVRQAAADAGRDPGAITPALQTFFLAAPTMEEARAMLDSRAIRFAALLADDELWKSRGATHPLGDGFRGMIDFVPQHYGRPELERAMAAVPLDLVEDSLIWGTPDRVVSQLRELGEAGLRHVVLQPVGALVSRRQALRSIGHLVRIGRVLRSGR